ncbi:MAG: hypothetical protein K5682_02035 [Lachnospiraceae bacterium]|nr:hypothetical protein [Lachnospiraceae bacterium]
MGTTVSYTNFDYTGEKLIPVIASFDTKGNVRPLYVRMEGIPRKIRSFALQTRFHNAMEFYCMVELEEAGRQVPLQLTYYFEEKIWTVPRGVR